MFRLFVGHLAVSIKVMHTGIYAIIVGRNPHVCILVHHAASSIEHVVVVADLGKALCSYAVSVIVCLSAAVNEAGLYKLRILVERVPAIAAEEACLNISRTGCQQHAIVLGKVVFTVKLIQTVRKLYTVNGIVKLAVLL